ncbi:hypothetical protein Smp_168790 [Schistosoma mansoni]|uniref:hypothetical protein n=1 Tax=Schistosoma mansoni TaxID=6183 RepID=UPI0001A62126|nr:hypothetical protein Smp_168790 [Schistosoma mansoni]|eukprot:XP_018651148.1 hypothetical protein Smp_168790 [Schistosoma mansoni]
MACLRLVETVRQLPNYVCQSVDTPSIHIYVNTFCSWDTVRSVGFTVDQSNGVANSIWEELMRENQINELIPGSRAMIAFIQVNYFRVDIETI